MDEMGHSDPELALRIYRQAMRREEGERERLRVLIEGAPLGESAEKGRTAADTEDSASVGEWTATKERR
jgi:hypothetical protein